MLGVVLGGSWRGLGCLEAILGWSWKSLKGSCKGLGGVLGDVVEHVLMCGPDCQKSHFFFDFLNKEILVKKLTRTPCYQRSLLASLLPVNKESPCSVFSRNSLLRLTRNSLLRRFFLVNFSSLDVFHSFWSSSGLKLASI